jgi:hypothetical protein
MWKARTAGSPPACPSGGSVPRPPPEAGEDDRRGGRVLRLSGRVDPAQARGGAEPEAPVSVRGDVGHVRVGEAVAELPARRVSSRQLRRATAGPDPDVALPVFMERPDDVVAQAVLRRVERLCAADVADEPLRRADPEHPVPGGPQGAEQLQGREGEREPSPASAAIAEGWRPDSRRWVSVAARILPWESSTRAQTLSSAGPGGPHRVVGPRSRSSTRPH